MTTAKRLVPTALLLSVFISSSPQIIHRAGRAPQQTVKADADVSARLTDYFEKAAGLGFSGAVLVAKDGKLLLRGGYGWADEKRRIPNVAETVFDIGSITKVFTAVAVMQLLERGKLSTTDSITKYFPQRPERQIRYHNSSSADTHLGA